MKYAWRRIAWIGSSSRPRRTRCGRATPVRGHRRGLAVPAVIVDLFRRQIVAWSMQPAPALRDGFGLPPRTVMLRNGLRYGIRKTRRRSWSIADEGA